MYPSTSSNGNDLGRIWDLAGISHESSAYTTDTNEEVSNETKDARRKNKKRKLRKRTEELATISSSSSDQTESGGGDERDESDADAEQPSAGQKTLGPNPLTVATIMDPVFKLERKNGFVTTKDSQNVLDRAVEYMQLYLGRYINSHFSTDWIRRLLFNARIHGAPISRIQIINLSTSEEQVKRMIHLHHSIGAGFLSASWSRNIDMEQFFDRMDYLETKYGERLWELHFIYGYEFFDKKSHQEEHIYFRWQIISTIRSLYKECENRNWAQAAKHISDIALTVASQHNAKDHFLYLRNSLIPYIPSIFLCALQCLLETKQPIEELSRHFIMAFTAFKESSLSHKNNLNRNYYWMDNLLFFFSHLLTFHLVNMNVQPEHKGSRKYLTRASIKDAGFDENTEHRRIVMLLEYCVDVEKYLLDEKTSEFKGKSAYIKIHKPNRSLATYFANFLNLLFEEPQSSVGLLPLAMWGAIQFNCEEEFTDYLIEACTKYPYLLIHVYNVCSRFRKEDIAGQLFERLFGLALDLLSTSPILLEILEQRSLDPTSFGTFDNIVSQNLRALFMFLDHGRHRADIRAWALFHSNLFYLYDSDDLMRAIVLPLWEKRKK